MKTKRGNRKKLRGVVLKNKMSKTIVVEVKEHKKHSFFEKRVLQRSVVYAHDEENKCLIGDKVLLMETRPLSKLKRWRVVKILREGEQL
ncbi:MAG: 30S ribosomal protein S17 [Candidatus Fischerbacteria bacterium RBG_13_37_8]|uniref:Small ribosomal subunit protein uS17 n=1 Tax=Candidatus Fischerbacteria bacterium RBG_13_37_8 TaxID=1817863 RepID=A0A1F5VDZ0_9BACT|nr:ribosomal protein S17 [uncultured bacterium]OGF61669.1 MAG: 30S ribosomal protein S17 [Candidatus Fischerbacteria bacterium RBG_13_37_8]